MALQTRNEATLGHPAGGEVNMFYEYDDALLRLTRVWLVSTVPAETGDPLAPTRFATAELIARRSSGTGPTYELRCPPGQTVEQAIPGSAANRLGVTVATGGKLDGVNWSLRFVAG